MSLCQSIYMFFAISISLLLGVTHVAASEQATVIFAAEMTEIATDKKGGYPELASILKQQRQGEKPVFFFFGGGSLGPSTLSSLDRGTHIIDLLNSLEPDAMGVAKREFSFLEDELSLRSYEAAFPLVASNLIDTLTQQSLDGLIESVIVQQGPYKFGVISVLDDSVIEEYAVTRIKVLNPKNAIEKQSKLLRAKGVDLVILLYSHLSPEISQLLKTGEIDLSLRRDEHFNPYQNPDNSHHPNDLLISEPGKIAVIQLSWEKGDASTLQLKWESEALSQHPKDPQVLRQVINYSDRLASLLRQKIGILKSSMDTSLENVRTRESSFGNYITDALKDYTGAEIAILNGGTIRGERKYAENTLLTRRDISNELPFRNKVILLKVTGKQIVEALENGFSLIEKVKGRFPQVSGLEITYDSEKAVGERVISVKVNGEVLQLKRVYRLATTDFLAIGGDGYSVFKNSPQVNYDNQMSRLVSDIVIDSIKTEKIISVSIESRLVDLKQTRSVQ